MASAYLNICFRCGALEQHDEKKCNILMMTDPDRWPRWPILPLKRSLSDPPPHAAILVESDVADNVEGKVVIYVANMFSIRVLSPERRQEFNSFEELYDAGWRVD